MKVSLPDRRIALGRLLRGGLPVAACVVLATLVGGGPIRAAGYTVQVHNYAFVAPNGGSTVTIRVGDKVTWVVAAVSDPHTVTSGHPGAIDNRFADHPASLGLLTSGQSFTTTFTNPGTYPYFCEIHPEQMSGVVKVLAASTPAPTAQPTPHLTQTTTAAPIVTPPITPAPTPPGLPTAAPSAAPAPTPSAGPSAAMSPAPSPTAAAELPASAGSAGAPAAFVLGGLAAIGMVLLLVRARRQRIRRGA